MSRKKAIIVTLVIAAMLAVILVGAHRIEPKAFTVLLSALACYGFLRGSGDVCRWMQAKEKPVETVKAEPVDDDPFAHDDEFEGSSPLFGGIRFRDAQFREANDT